MSYIFSTNGHFRLQNHVKLRKEMLWHYNPNLCICGLNVISIGQRDVFTLFGLVHDTVKLFLIPGWSSSQGHPHDHRKDQASCVAVYTCKLDLCPLAWPQVVPAASDWRLSVHDHLAGEWLRHFRVGDDPDNSEINHSLSHQPFCCGDLKLLSHGSGLS